ncbi:uncharacterized protein LOC129187399 isoform X2 [Dunckerocampus dactyliophorus]|uniref:uncharacterized protein LOC129187399 isoform X2 n=1 Tax=Dunckerocampus dactyliophorus TaxID=161453 RepID=UPI002406E129|nr:uncharacterized protein LOC129187399 isoform X2 [Dunckerocampus dactyliophorus]
MGCLSLIRALFNDDIDAMLEKILQMLPSSFSVEESHLYTAEMLMRQFVLMKQWDQVPRHVCVDHMKQWILAKRSFLQEFQEMKSRTDARMFNLLEVAWIRARFQCLNLMEKEVWEELDEETRLSQLLGRRVTLEGLQMFLLSACPTAEEDVYRFLQHLFNELLSINRSKMLMLFPEFQRSTVHLVREVVEHAVSVFLEEQEPPAEGHTGLDSTPASLTRRVAAASMEISRMLARALTSCSCISQQIAGERLNAICMSVGGKMATSVLTSFAERSASFHLLDYDQSFFTARDCIVNAFEDLNSIATSK